MFTCILQSLKQHSDTLSIHNVSVSKFSTTVYLCWSLQQKSFQSFAYLIWPFLSVLRRGQIIDEQGKDNLIRYTKEFLKNCTACKSPTFIYFLSQKYLPPTSTWFLNKRSHSSLEMCVENDTVKWHPLFWLFAFLQNPVSISYIPGKDYEKKNCCSKAI